MTITLQYPNKRATADIIAAASPAKLESVCGAGAANKLIHGDNLPVMKALLNDYGYAGKVDLVYIDPPFATNAVFRAGADRANSVSASGSDAVAYSDRVVGADFLEFLRERLALLRELMADHASIYLHIDYKIGHYVKVLMDEIFGAKNFRNDIARVKCNPKNFRRKAYGNVKDLILFYSKTDKVVWNEPKLPFSDADKARLFGKTDADGRRYATIPLHAPGETAAGSTGKAWRGIPPPKGRHWRSDPKTFDELDAQGLIEWSANGLPRKKIFMDERGGKRAQDIWEFKDPQRPAYPTQKNGDMLDFIVAASSEEGALALDCFCGSGTALAAAHKLGRRWIGVDSSPVAVAAARKRLSDMPPSLLAPNGAEYEFLRAV